MEKYRYISIENNFHAALITVHVTVPYLELHVQDIQVLHNKNALLFY